jgi:hypothetical protein
LHSCFIKNMCNVELNAIANKNAIGFEYFYPEINNYCKEADETDNCTGN